MVDSCGWRVFFSNAEVAEPRNSMLGMYFDPDGEQLHIDPVFIDAD